MPRAKLAKMSVEELKKEILRRQRVLPKLIADRDALDKKIAELQGLGELKAAPKPARKKLAKKRARKAMRASRAGSLSSKLAEVLQGKARMSIAEAMEAVLAAGYKTKSKNFSTIIGMTLSKDKRFRRVRKGQYSLRG
jgi:hypothetical protein